MGSAFGSPVDVKQLSGFDIEKNPSPFQRRMVKADIDKSLARDLRTSDFDILLVDFIDERFSVFRVGDGLVTRSTDAVKCGLRGHPSNLIHFGTNEHLDMFRAGWDRLLHTVPADKIIVNRVYWADVDSSGEPVEDPRTVSRSNDTLRRLYGVAEQNPEVRFIDYPAASFTAATDHKWGRSPFHYVPQMYEVTLRALAQLA